MKEKFIAYKNGQTKEYDLFGTFEEATPSGKLSVLKLIYAIITEKGFLWKLENTIRYALRHYECYRGQGASDVIAFKISKNYKKIWNKK